MKDKLGVSLIGACSGISRAMYIPAIMGNDFLELKVLSDISENIQQLAEDYDCSYTDNIYEAVYHDDVDIVIITSPDQLHCEHSILSLKAGKHTICTKPLALTLDEAFQIKESVDASGKLFMCGMNMRYCDWVVQIKQLINSGKIGDPVLISWRSKGDYYNYPANSFYRKAESGGQLLHNGAHYLDIMSYWGGSLPISVYGRSARGPMLDEDRVEFDNYHSLSLEFESGAMGLMEYNQLLINPRGYPTLTSILIVGSDGMIELCETEQRAIEIYSGGQLMYPSLPSQDRSGFDLMIKDFTDAVIFGNDSPIPIENSIRILETCIEGIASCRHGKVIELGKRQELCYA